jgi:hypothetical protein
MRILLNGLPPSADPAAGVAPGRPFRQPGRIVLCIFERRIYMDVVLIY